MEDKYILEDDESAVIQDERYFYIIRKSTGKVENSIRKVDNPIFPLRAKKFDAYWGIVDYELFNDMAMNMQKYEDAAKLLVYPEREKEEWED